ncbi:hypothetical protein UFOVP223_13 [uncultured Caudovirales phage]|uniref:Uncharacterized protein n=1 Tax=uncultured Caudovirales phage TaxID=2100421 RepID=A0A6J5L0C6_9CAUD|nr:hypothetical protein UFOVP110_17 [uncultured Caudovirales phage]CAB5218958.1 hypothetical protein UFOVP223_13 [uncultured Caudovirales phage]
MAGQPKGRIGRVVKPKSVPTAKPAGVLGRPRVYEDDDAAKAAKNERNKAAARAETQEGIAAAGEEAGAAQQQRAETYLPRTDLRPAFSEAKEELPDIRSAFNPIGDEAAENSANKGMERSRRFFAPLNKQNFPKLLDDQLGHVWKMQGYIDELKARLGSYQSGYRPQDVSAASINDQDDSYIDSGEDTRIKSKFQKYDEQVNGQVRKAQFGEDERRNRAVIIPMAHLNAAQDALDRHIFAHQDGNGGTARLYLGDAADHLMQAFNHIANHATNNNNPDPEVKSHSTGFTSILSDGENNEYKDTINLRPMPSVLTLEVNKYAKRIAGYYNEDAPESKSYSRGRDTDAVHDMSPSIRNAYFEAGRTEKEGDKVFENPDDLSEGEQEGILGRMNKPDAEAQPNYDNTFLYGDTSVNAMDTKALSAGVTDSTLRSNDFLRTKGRGLSKRRAKELAPARVLTPEEQQKKDADAKAKLSVVNLRKDREDAKEHWLNQPGNTALSYLNSEALRDPSGYMERVRSQPAPVQTEQPPLTREEHNARAAVYQGHIDNIISHLRRGKDVPVESALAVGPEGVAHARSIYRAPKATAEEKDPFGEKMRVEGPSREDITPDFEAKADAPEFAEGPGGESPEAKKGRSVSAFLSGVHHEELFGGAE